MSYLHEVDELQASDEVARLYEEDRARLGHVANYTRTFSARPAVYRAWQALNGSVKAATDLRTYEVATVAAARELRSSYCLLAHGSVLAGIVGETGVHELVAGDDGALDARDRAVARLAAKVATDASSITPDDYAELRGLGVDDAGILDVVLAAAARCFFSTVLDATGTLPDAAYASALSPALVGELTVGRPIEESAG
ncbi:carboxymuconolactone decarboxylase family protein [Microlunatus ginsengisoli]|uniref:Peroxidase-related enzyme n=1 Tax=Microlunatus ginsengisoli TaxID=363863 RepID=A0ABP6ZG36_9ACTN